MLAQSAFSDAWWTQAVSLFAWTTATWFIFRGAFMGSPQHAWPRWFLGFTTLIFSITFLGMVVNWWEFSATTAWLRGTTWMLCIALSLTAWTGVRYGKKVDHAIGRLEEMADESDAGADYDS